MKEDCLQFILDVTINQVRKRYMRFLIFMSFLTHSTEIFIHIRYFLKTLDVLHFARYPSYFLSIVACSLIACGYIERRELIQMTVIVKNQFWDIDAYGPETKQYILQRCSNCKAASIVISLIVIIGLLSMLREVSDQCNFFFLLEVLSYEFPQYRTYVSLYYMLTLLVIVYCVTGFALFILYLMEHCRIQAILSQALMKKNSRFYLMDQCRVIRDSKYQERVFKALCVCIEHHLCLKRFAKRCNVAGTEAINLLAVTGLAAACCVPAYAFISLQDTCFTTSHYISQLALFAAIISVICSYCFIGQHLKDMSEGWCNDLYNQPWYQWNNKNRQIMKLHLMMLQKPTCLYAYRMIPIDNTLILKIVNWVYTVATLAHKMGQISKN